MKSAGFRVLLAGFLGGFVGNAVMGILFMSPPIHGVLYDPSIQSKLFIDITQQRNIPLSVAGLVVLSIIPAVLFSVLHKAIPYDTWLKKGLFWGLTIWAMFWLMQEWFIYHTLLQEPLALTFIELIILLVGSLVQGIIIAYIIQKK